MRTVSLEGFVPGDRFDGNPWTQARIEESPGFDGPWTPLQTISLASGPGVYPVGLDADPKDPQSRSFTTSAAQLDQGFYRVVFIDASTEEQPTPAVYDGGAATSYTSVGAVRRVLSPDGSEDPTLGTAASLSDEELEEAISEAAQELDAKLATRYSLPFSGQVPPLVAALNRDIAAYLATLVYRRGDPIDVNDPLQLRYNRAQALLGQVQSGAIELADIQTGSEVIPVEAAVANVYDGDLFTVDSFNLGFGRVWPRMPFTYEDLSG